MHTVFMVDILVRCVQRTAKHFSHNLNVFLHIPYLHSVRVIRFPDGNIAFAPGDTPSLPATTVLLFSPKAPTTIGCSAQMVRLNQANGLILARTLHLYHVVMVTKERVLQNCPSANDQTRVHLRPLHLRHSIPLLPQPALH